MKAALPLLLALNGGYVDTAGYLALQGLFPAHVTGNFVTLGASLVLGTSGVAAKLIALPAFCLVVVLARLLGNVIRDRGGDALRILFGIKLVLLIAGAALAIHFGPFPDGDAWTALVTGWALIAAMAIQNAVQRIHMPGAPPTNIMTGNTTQLMIDLADVVFGTTDGNPPDAALARLKRIAATLGTFIAGCAAGAALFAYAGMWCFAAPPLVALAAILIRADFAPPPGVAAAHSK